MTAALEGGEWSAARPGRTLPPGKTRYPFYRRLGGPQGRSERAENFFPTGIRSPDRPARSSVAIPTELPGPPFIIYIYIYIHTHTTHTHTHTQFTNAAVGRVGVLCVCHTIWCLFVTVYKLNYYYYYYYYY